MYTNFEIGTDIYLREMCVVFLTFKLHHWKYSF